jgi:hypothetical protein
MRQRDENDDQDRPPLEVCPEPTAAPAEANEPMKCVWSGYPSHDRDCRSRIPASVVVKAWHREMQLKGTSEGFFNFSWRNGVWLAYGTPDGGVRGVYCPTHCSERSARDGGDDEPPSGLSTGIALR